MMIRLRHLGGQRGQVLVVFGLSCVALFAVLALAIDGGRMLMDERALQNAADGASLLAASDIGPGADPTQVGWAEDDAVLSVERSLAIDFSNNYTGKPHRLIGGLGNCLPAACSPPWSPTACCTNWADTTGTYLFSIRTPLAFGTAEPEAVVQVRLTHHMSLMVGGNLWPQIDVNVQSTARNYAIPYAIFTFKHNDEHDLDGNGGASLAANKRIGANGAGKGGGMTFTCIVPPSGGATRWGGDFYTYSGLAGISPASQQPSIAGTKEGTCPSPGTAAGTVALSNYILPPNVHLPDDPCLLVPNPCGAAQAVQPSLSVTGTQMLQPTIPADPTQPLGPRYSLVSVSSGATLYLQPGVYFFEGTVAGSGLYVTSGGTAVTGDCWSAAGPTEPNCSSAAVCGVTITPLVGAGNIFKCGAGADMGVLLVFWPHGTDVPCVAGSYPDAAHPYCSYGAGTSGSDNQLHIQGTANLYITSSPRYHSVVLHVNPAHASSSWNFTTQATLPPGFTTQTDAAQLGNGSNVVYANGGGSISVVGATFAPQDNVLIGGASGGKGYGQMLAYYIHYQGSAVINESYNPLALVYSPVILR